METNDYRDALAAYLAEKRLGPKLSLRGFARTLGLSPSTLHDLLGRKTHLSRPRFRELLSRVKFSKTYRRHLILTYDFAIAETPARKARLAERIEANRLSHSSYEVKKEHFPALVNWETLAVHEYLGLTSSGRKVIEIARALDIAESAVVLAVNHLAENGYLKKDEKNVYSRKRSRVLAEAVTDNGWLKKVHLTALERAGRAMNSQSAENRHSATEFLAVDPALLPRLRSITNEYLDRIQVVADRSKNRSALYSVSLCLYRLDPTSESREPIE